MDNLLPTLASIDVTSNQFRETALPYQQWEVRADVHFWDLKFDSTDSAGRVLFMLLSGTFCFAEAHTSSSTAVLDAFRHVSFRSRLTPHLVPLLLAYRGPYRRSGHTTRRLRPRMLATSCRRSGVGNQGERVAEIYCRFRRLSSLHFHARPPSTATFWIYTTQV